MNFSTEYLSDQMALVGDPSSTQFLSSRDLEGRVRVAYFSGELSGSVVGLSLTVLPKGARIVGGVFISALSDPEGEGGEAGGLSIGLMRKDGEGSDLEALLATTEMTLGGPATVRTLAGERMSGAIETDVEGPVGVLEDVTLVFADVLNLNLSSGTLTYTGHVKYVVD